ncbi:MAG: hypothetical protein ACFFBD_23790 [Candidatus Hodarchaeota archaeon]
MFCPNCGKEISSFYVFCAHCGVNLTPQTPSTSQPNLERYYDLEMEVDGIRDEIASLPVRHVYLNRLKETKAIKDKELQRVRTVMKKEKTDYDELVRVSFASIKARLGGNIDEKKKKEEAEYLAVLANFQDIEQEARQLENEIRTLGAEIESINQQKRKISQLESEMHQILEQLTVGKSSKTLMALESKYNLLRGELAELQSIEHDLKQVQSLLSQAEKSFLTAKNALGSAKGFATWDTFFGGGAIVDSLKHSKLDNARHAINNAQTCIQRAKNLVDGLDDIYVHFEAPNFLVDFFFDSFFFDLFGNMKISRTFDRVNGALNKLRENQNNLTRYILDNEQQKMRFIEQVNIIRENINKERLALLN